MEWIIAILAALVAVLFIILASYRRQIREICRQLAFLKEHDSNLLITRQMDSFGIRELTDELNEMLERQREQRRRYLKNETYELKLEPLYLNRILVETAFSYYDVWLERGIEPDIEITETQLQIEGNETGLRRTIQNMMKNGLDHGEGAMRLSLKQKDGWAVVECSNYTAQPEEIDVEKVFERFYKADEARTRTSSSGLGLSIAKEFTLRMHGEIRAFLKGNWFTIRLSFPILSEGGHA